MLEFMNAAACAVLLFLTFPVAVAMHHSGYWPQRLAFVAVVVLLGLQVVAPVYSWLPEPNWMQAVFNLILLSVVICARSQIMALVRITVGEAASKSTHSLRRAEDLSMAQYSRVHGKGTEQ